MASELSSQKNKAILWSLMVEAGVFGGVPPSKRSQVVSIFEDSILSVESTGSGTLMEQNKDVLMRVNGLLDPLREGAVDNRPSQEPPKLVTAADISARRQERFADNLNERQREFDSMISVKKPSDVDFSDKNADEKPIGSEMDSMLAKMMARREQELNQVMKGQDTSAAQTWISNDGSGAKAGPPTLQIGEELRRPNVEEVKSRPRVTFADDEENDSDSILSLFKVKERKVDAKVVADVVNQVEKKVSEIVSLLETLKTTVG